MSKPVLGLILGAVLGVLDGLSSLFYPEAAPKITEIVSFLKEKHNINESEEELLSIYSKKLSSLYQKSLIQNYLSFEIFLVLFH